MMIFPIDFPPRSSLGQMARLTDFPAQGSAFSAIPQTKKLAARKGHKAVQFDTARLRSMVFSHSELLYLS